MMNSVIAWFYFWVKYVSYLFLNISFCLWISHLISFSDVDTRCFTVIVIKLRCFMSSGDEFSKIILLLAFRFVLNTPPVKFRDFRWLRGKQPMAMTVNPVTLCDMITVQRPTTAITSWLQRTSSPPLRSRLFAMQSLQSSSLQSECEPDTLLDRPK